MGGLRECMKVRMKYKRVGNASSCKKLGPRIATGSEFTEFIYTLYLYILE